MPGGLARALACGCSVIVTLFTLPVSQTARATQDCEPSEIDMGDYCVRKSRQPGQSGPGAQRMTPFRSRSMMPGRVGHIPPPDPPGLPVNSMNAVPGEGWGVQLGVFSEKTKALAIISEAQTKIKGPYHLAPMAQGERILWAVVHGPFQAQSEAIAARVRLLEQTRFYEAFVKPLDELKLIEPDAPETQK